MSCNTVQSLKSAQVILHGHPVGVGPDAGASLQITELVSSLHVTVVLPLLKEEDGQSEQYLRKCEYDSVKYGHQPITKQNENT